MLIIGIDVYKDCKLDPLPSCKKDAKDISTFFKKTGFANYKYKLTSPIIGSNIIDEEYSWADLALTIKRFFNQARPSQTLLFYYSGHGVNAQEDVYLTPPQIDSTNPEEVGLALSRLTKSMAMSKSKRIVGIIDACFSGSINIPDSRQKKKSAEKNAVQSLGRYNTIWKNTPKNKGISLLLSSQAYEPSLAVENKNSLYTGYLLEGLNGVTDYRDENGFVQGSIDTNGDVTPDSLHNYVCYKVSTEADQIPKIKQDISSKIILASYPEFKTPKLNFITLENEVPWSEIPKNSPLYKKVKRLESLMNLFRSLNRILTIFKNELREYEKTYIKNIKIIRGNYFKLLNYIQLSSLYDTRAYDEKIIIKYKWGLVSAQFNKGTPFKKKSNDQLEILEANVGEIYKMYKELLPDLEKIEKFLKGLPQSASWNEESPPPPKIKGYRTRGLNLIKEIKNALLLF